MFVQNILRTALADANRAMWAEYRKLLSAVTITLFAAFVPTGVAAQTIFYPTEAETTGGWNMFSAFKDAFVSPPAGFLTPAAQEGSKVIHINTSGPKTTGTAYIPLIGAGTAAAGGIRQGTYVVSIDAGNYSDLGFPLFNFVGLRVDGTANPNNVAGMGTVITTQTPSVPTPASGQWATWTFTLVVPAGDPLIGRSLGFAFEVEKTGNNEDIKNAAIDNLRMLPPQAAVSTVTITNTTNAAEPTTNGLMTVSLSAARAVPTIVSYTVSGTAVSGMDYTALTGSVTIPAGSLSAPITISVLDDLIVEGPETVVVTLTAVSSGNVQLSGTAANLTATNTIADNDAAGPVISVTKVVDVTTTDDFETLSYTITLTNLGTTSLLASQITFTDVLTQGAAVLTLDGAGVTRDQTGTTLAPLASWTYSGSYKITEQNYIAGGGSLLNTFTATATVQDGTSTLTTTKTATATTLITIDPDLDVVKTAKLESGADVPATGGVVGDVIVYSYAVRNRGNVSMTDLVLDDVHEGKGDPLVFVSCLVTDDRQTQNNSTAGTTAFEIDTLAPRDTITCTAKYTIVQADIDELQIQ